MAVRRGEDGGDDAGDDASVAPTSTAIGVPFAPAVRSTPAPAPIASTRRPQPKTTQVEPAATLACSAATATIAANNSAPVEDQLHDGVLGRKGWIADRVVVRALVGGVAAGSLEVGADA